eukprot:gene22974-30163_t
MPTKPALMLMHTTSGWMVKLNPQQHGLQWGPHVEDWHNMLVAYYGNVQAVSIRNVIFELMDEYKDRLQDLEMWDMPPNGQIMHPEQTGVAIYSDIVVHYWQRVAKQVIAKMMLDCSVLHLCCML